MKKMGNQAGGFVGVLALLVAFVFVAACRESDAPPPPLQPAASEAQTGSITATVVWPGENVTTVGGLSLAPMGDPFRWVVPVGVSTIRGRVTATDITTPPETTISVSPGDSGTGQVTGVPPGTNRTLTVDGLDSSGTSLFSGQTTGINVFAGQTTDAGSVNLWYTGGLEIYDDFASGSLDRKKWIHSKLGPGCSQSFSTAEYTAQHTLSSDSVGHCFLRFIEAADTGTFSADVTVTEYTENSGDIYARLLGIYYNSGGAGAATGSCIGDVFALFRVHDFSPATGSGVARATIGFFTNSSCTASTLINSQDFGTVQLGQTYNLEMAWDGQTSFTFKVDGGAAQIAFDVSATAPNLGISNLANIREFGTRAVSAPQGSITAAFDNVRCVQNSGAACPLADATITIDVSATTKQRWYRVFVYNQNTLVGVTGKIDRQANQTTTVKVPSATGAPTPQDALLGGFVTLLTVFEADNNSTIDVGEERAVTGFTITDSTTIQLQDSDFSVIGTVPVTVTGETSIPDNTPLYCIWHIGQRSNPLVDKLSIVAMSSSSANRFSGGSVTTDNNEPLPLAFYQLTCVADVDGNFDPNNPAATPGDWTAFQTYGSSAPITISSPFTQVP